MQVKRVKCSVEAKKHIESYISKKKMKVSQDKCYEKLSMDSLTKRYKSIPVEERLPTGTVESDETEEILSAEREGEQIKQLCDNDPNHLIEQISDIGGDIYHNLILYWYL